MFSRAPAEQAKPNKTQSKEDEKQRLSLMSFNSLNGYEMHLQSEYHHALLEYGKLKDAQTLEAHQYLSTQARIRNEKADRLIELNNLRRRLEFCEDEEMEQKRKYDCKMKEESAKMAENQQHTQLSQQIQSKQARLKQEIWEQQQKAVRAQESVWRIGSELAGRKATLIEFAQRKQLSGRRREELQEAIEGKESATYQLFKQMQQKEEILSVQSAEIQAALQTQSLLLRRYEQLKKKQLDLRRLNRAGEQELAQAVARQNSLAQSEKQMFGRLKECETGLTFEKRGIALLEVNCARQSDDLAKNEQTLNELYSYLQELVAQRSRIEATIQHTLLEDYTIHDVIDRKRTMKYAEQLLHKAQNEEHPMEKHMETATSSRGFGTYSRSIE